MVHLDDDQRLVAQTVREFVNREVIPVASDMEHRDEYPDGLVDTMRQVDHAGIATYGAGADEAAARRGVVATIGRLQSARIRT